MQLAQARQWHPGIGQLAGIGMPQLMRCHMQIRSAGTIAPAATIRCHSEVSGRPMFVQRTGGPSGVTGRTPGARRPAQQTPRHSTRRRVPGWPLPHTRSRAGWPSWGGLSRSSPSKRHHFAHPQPAPPHQHEPGPVARRRDLLPQLLDGRIAQVAGQLPAPLAGMALEAHRIRPRQITALFGQKVEEGLERRHPPVDRRRASTWLGVDCRQRHRYRAS